MYDHFVDQAALLVESVRSILIAAGWGAEETLAGPGSRRERLEAVAVIVVGMPRGIPAPDAGGRATGTHVLV